MHVYVFEQRIGVIFDRYL